MKDRKRILKAMTVALAVIVVGIAVCIMVRRQGVSPDYDFGAGAYYYADDPALQDLADSASYTTTVPDWVHYVLFLAWGAFMWALWKWIDRKP